MTYFWIYSNIHLNIIVLRNFLKYLVFFLKDLFKKLQEDFKNKVVV